MLIFAVLTVGFSGLVVQVLLLRELLVSFYGNELTLGIILANWVFLEAMGALLLGKLVDRINKRLLAFGALNIIFIFSFIICLYLARTFKTIFNFASGVGLGIDSIYWSSFLILLPVSFTHGGLFSFCAKIYASHSKYVEGQAVGQVYFWETIGTVLAGIAFTYFLIPYLDSFQIAFIILFLNFIMLWYLFAPLEKAVKKQSLRARFNSLKIPFNKTSEIKSQPEVTVPPEKCCRGARFIPLIFILFLFFLCLPVSNWLQNTSIKLQWQNQEVLDYANSIYGNVVVTRQKEQYTFFLDGQPAITSPFPDIIFVQEFAQLPLLFHPYPRNILFISGGAGGLINEILKNPFLSKIDYLELDPLILKMVERYPTDLTRGELTDPRVNILNLDGRFYIKNTDSTYDVIYLGLSSPSELQTNRLFTQEFFTQAKKRLNPGGILTFTLPGSLTYLSKELKDLNACILNSLEKAFLYSRVIPGDFNLFLASDFPDIIKADSHLIIQRIRERGLDSDLFLPSYIEYRLNKRWAEWFSNALGDATGRSNLDFSAFALFKTLNLWNAQFSPSWQRIFLGLEKINLVTILIFLFVFSLLLSFIFQRRKKVDFILPYVIASSGFFGMLINLIIIFSFQIVHGYLYYQIAMLIAFFMLGAALGSILISRYLSRLTYPLKLLAGLEIGIILWIFVTLFIILSYPAHFIFFILCAITGFWVGMEFPLVNKIYLQDQNRIGATVGVIYAADLIGGWFAAVFSGILFLPILGLMDSCWVILALKVISLIFLSLIYFSKAKLIPFNN